MDKDLAKSIDQLTIELNLVKTRQVLLESILFMLSSKILSKEDADYLESNFKKSLFTANEEMLKELEDDISDVRILFYEHQKNRESNQG